MCDTVCSVQAGRTLFAKNSDRPMSEAQVVQAFAPRAPGGRGGLHTQYLAIDDDGAIGVLGARPDWLWGFEHGINEHRVAIGNEKLWTVEDPAKAPAALIGMDLVRLGLERGRDADGALEVITAALRVHGQGGVADASAQEPYFSSFLIADPAKAWVLETSGRHWAARPVEGGGVAISNRISLRRDWTRASDGIGEGDDWDRFRDPDAWTGLADVRLATTRPAVEGAGTPPTVADLAALLRDHHGGAGLPSPDIGADGTGITVCMHVRGYQCTTSAMIADLSVDPDEPLRAWVAMGSPCTSIFVPVFPPYGVPEPMAEVASYQRFAELRARTEVEPWDQVRSDDALAEIRAVFDPLEASLWEEADTSVHDAPARAAFVDGAWSQVDAALTKLGV